MKHIDFISRNNINEAYGDRDSTFRSCDRVIGPDGTIYNPKYIISLINNACDILTDVTQGTITKYLGALPILYTFSVDTMATDTKFIYMNPGFVMHLFELCGHTVMGIAFVIMHEVYHNLFMHHAREAADPARFSNHMKANIAQDYEINWVIEHSFPDMRSESETDPDDPEDSPFNKDGSRKQIMEGITSHVGGAINKKYANMCWEDIYDKMSSEDTSQFSNDKTSESDSDDIPTSQDFDNGYRDGWNDAVREAREQGLLESATIDAGFLKSFIKLFESAGKSQDYDTGYNLGRQKALEIIKALAGGASTPGQSGAQAASQQGPKLHPINGLETIKPKSASTASSTQQPAGENNQNTPVDIQTSSRQSASQSHASQDSSQGSSADANSNTAGSSDSTSDSNDGSSNTGRESGDSRSETPERNISGDASGSSAEDSLTGGFDNIKNSGSSTDSVLKGSDNGSATANGGKASITSAGQYSDGYSLKDETIKVGLADGKYTGKRSVGAGVHHISEAEGRALQKAAGYEDPSKDPNYAGRAENNPFTEGNWEELEKAIKTIDKLNKATLNSRPGTGSSSTLSAIANKIKNVMTPMVDWREEMKKRLDAAFTELADAGWNKKGITRNIYTRFDDYEGSSMQNLIIMIDTSGSVESRPKFLQQIISEFNDIGRTVNPKCIDLVLFNDGIYYEEEIEDEDAPDLTDVFKKHMQSGGTTYMECFKYIQKEYIDEGKPFACCVIFTDTDITWNTSHQIPKEEDLKWDPGHEGDDAAKLLWFILNDSNKHIEMPYGGIIEVSQEQFENSLKNNYMTNESAAAATKVPRRNIMIKKSLNEGGYFKRVDTAKKKMPAVSPEVAPEQSSTLEPELTVQTPVKKKRTDLARRRATVIRALRATGKIDEYRQLIRNWLLTHTNITRQDLDGNYYDTNIRVVITDDLYIIVNKDLIITGDSLTTIESFINFKKVIGNLTIGSNRKLEELPAGLPVEVTEDFMCINMPNLKSLWGAPLKVGGNYIVMGCNDLESLDGAPRSSDDFGGYFLSDNKFSNDDFFDTIQNGGVMPNSDYELDTASDSESASTEVAEAISKRKQSVALVESRIGLGKKFNALNEAFASRILSRLAKNPKNHDALNAMKDMNVFWSDIPDEIITPVYGSVAKLIQTRKVLNGDTTKFGITICCDNNDVINIIATGNNKKEWRGNTWKFLNPNVRNLINDRIGLVQDAATLSPYIKADYQAEVREQLDALGINWQKPSIQKLQQIYSAGDLTFSHLYLIPDMCAKSYVIKGIDDGDASNISELSPEQKQREELTGIDPRQFSYRSQALGREALSHVRFDANSGVVSNPKYRTFNTTDDEGNEISKKVKYSLRDREKDPAYKKYYKVFVDSDILTEIQKCHGSKVSLKRCIESMVESVRTAMKKVRTELYKSAFSGEIDADFVDALAARLALSTYSKFKKTAADSINSIDIELKRSQGYIDKYLTTKEYLIDDDGNPKIVAGKPVKATFSIDKKSPSALFAVDSDGMPMKDADGNWVHTSANTSVIRNNDWRQEISADDILAKDPVSVYISYYNSPTDIGIIWYRYYIQTLKIFAEVMAALDSAKRGHPEKLKEYVDKVNSVVTSRSLAIEKI